MGDFEDRRFWRGFKASEKPDSQAEASPQQVESLAAVVRPSLLNLSQSKSASSKLIGGAL